MIEMSHIEEDLNDAGLFSANEKQLAVADVSRKCNTALEILQNEVMNCEKNISLEKSQRELNEKKLERDEQLKKVSSQVTAVYTSSGECAEHVGNNYSAIFNNDQFGELIENIMRVGNHFNGIEEDDVQKIIFEFAELNEINHGFDKTLRKTKNEWYQWFIQSHPNLNSVIKKSFDDSVQLHKTDIEFSSRIVDKFVSDYKNSKRNVAKTGQLAKYEKYANVWSKTEQVLEPSKSCQEGEHIWSEYDEKSVSSRVVSDFEATNGYESNNFPSEKSDSTTKVVCTESTAAHADSKHPCLNTLKGSDSPECMESEEVPYAVSSLCSNNSHLGDECSAKGNLSVNDENISKEQLSDSFENSETKKYDNVKLVEVNSTNHIAELSSITTFDSNKIPHEKFYTTTISTEAKGIETKRSDDDINIGVFNCVNKESSDVIFSRNPNNASYPEAMDLEPKTAENVEKQETVEMDSSTNDDSNFDECDYSSPKNLTEFPLGIETDTGEKSNNETDLNTTCSNVPFTSDMSASKRRETGFSTEPEDEGDKKTLKVFKRKRSLHKKTTKKSKKYVYKLKSYNTVSVFQFTSSTPYSFMKPVIKLTKLDEGSFKNLDSGITSFPSNSVEQEANDIDKMGTSSGNGNNERDAVGADINSDAGSVEKHEVEAESSTNISNNSKDEVETESNHNFNNDLKNEVETETRYIGSDDSKNKVETEANYNASNDSKDEVGAETNYCVNNDLTVQEETERKDNVCGDSKDEVETEVNCSASNVSKDEVEAETNFNSENKFENEVEAETNSNSENKFENEVEVDTNLSQDNNSKNEVEEKSKVGPCDDSNENENKAEISSNTGEDLKGQMTKSPKTTAKKNLNRSNNGKSETPTLKMNSTNESLTPTFGMQTRRKRLKFLPDGTLVTPNQRHPHFLEDLSSSSRSESKTAKKRCIKTPPQDTPRPEKKMKVSSASSTPKQTNRSTVPTKKVSRSRPDRYIPEPNGKSKKPQKIFDYDSYYRENFRETEVKLPPSCKKQMVALSKVTSISPAAQSGAQFTVNPAQLLSCLLGMPITPDQIRTVRFKPPVKQLKSNKQINITPSKLASNDDIKPITKRHLEMLQKTPFNIVPKTEIGVAKCHSGTKSKPVS